MREHSSCRGRLKARTAAAWKSCMNFQNKCRNVPWRLTADGPTGTVTPLITNGTFTLKRRLTTTRHTVASETLFKLPVVTAIPPVQNLKFTWHMPSAPPVHSCSYSLSDVERPIQQLPRLPTRPAPARVLDAHGLSPELRAVQFES